ncbi:hypothetical protein BFR47_08935 [Oceanisphaera psychrotolerans]|uniref:Uncharacterized protein n=1 Tax=Oceanisphaera psychrotolerans TaxID=1414654 RepID=A0A1J4QJ55_9GAMM|nr:hypothetical protein BFR47_08935 [Oceanisphaera psychrotolerans]
MYCHITCSIKVAVKLTLYICITFNKNQDAIIYPTNFTIWLNLEITIDDIKLSITIERTPVIHGIVTILYFNFFFCFV